MRNTTRLVPFTLNISYNLLVSRHIDSIVKLVPLCLPFTVACPGLEDIDFGTITYSSDPNDNGRYLVGTTASYECDINYRLSGMESRVCENDMEWSGVAPICEREFRVV